MMRVQRNLFAEVQRLKLEAARNAKADTGTANPPGVVVPQQQQSVPSPQHTYQLRHPTGATVATLPSTFR